MTAQLRLAISMRGGVSLAVWIGGALAEIDVLRRSRPSIGVTASADPNAPIYARLLDLAGYTSVQVDVMSGASAGGLNGAIYATSLLYDVDFRHMLPIWVRLADLESMIRVDTKDPVTGRPADSLLEGDEYFLARLTAELGQLTDASAQGPRPVVPYLDLLLTGTLLTPAEEIVVGAPGENLSVGRREAFFQFHHEQGSEEPPISHFRGPGVTMPSIVAKLALAGRASASFPFAFEPATVTTDAGAAGGAGPDLATIFSERGAPHAFRVMDGGVLDNIPIARAIRAVAASPAAEPTDRWLLYLYPSPPDDVPPPPPPPQAPVRALSTVRRALTAKLNTESILDDTAALDQHNVEASFQAIRWRALWHGAGADETAWPAWLRRLGEMAAVVEIRAATDAVRLRQVLEQPRRRYAGRPDVLADPGTPMRDLELRAPAVAEALSRGLESALRTTFGRDPDGLGRDAVTVRSAIDLLIGACRAVERAVPGVATPKRDLYARRAAAERAVFDGELALLAAMVAEPPEVGGPRAWLDRHLQIVPPPAAALTAVADALAALQPVVGALPDDPIVRPYRMLRLVDVDGLLAMARHGVSMLATTLQNPAPLTLKVISGAAPTPLAEELHAYRSQVGRPPPDGDRIYVDDKLAGNAVGNFAAFLKADWRINDWTWGRADAASRLAEALLERLDAARPGTEAGLRELWAELGEDPADGFVDELLAELATAGPSDARHRLWRVVVRRLQLELWRHHLPLIESAQSRSEPAWRPVSPVVPTTSAAAPGEASRPVLTDEQTLARLRVYDVGRQSITAIDAEDRRRIAMRLAKIGFAALLPARTFADPEPAVGTSARRDLDRTRRAAALGRAALWPLRPIVLGAVFVVAAPRRAIAMVAMATVAVAVGWWAVDLAGWGPERYLVPGIPAVLLSLAAVAAMLTREDGGRVGAGLGVAAVALVALFVAVDLVPDDSWVLWPGWIAVSGVVFATIGTSWMRPTHRFVSAGLAVVVYGGTAAAFWLLTSPPGSFLALERPFPAGWWTISAILLAAVGLGVQVDQAQVFRHRPGRDA
ncbi:MAG: patatin-like protein [Ilumatobacteraceae bacterium]